MIHILSISGGKDSTATWLESIERCVETQRVFADTGHEHPQTYEYLDYLEGRLGPIRHVKADFTERFETRRRNLPELWAKDGISDERIAQALELLHPTGIPFLDLCMLKGRFPSTMRRFCSQELKGIPIRRQVFEPLLDTGKTVISWQGVRADESLTRKNLDVVEEGDYDGLINYRPIITWSADQVFAMHRRHNVRWNPLYEQGMSRVGCMPCIHERKAGIQEIARRFPEEIERVAQWERLVCAVSKRGPPTFFSADKTSGVAVRPEATPISVVVEWSSTSRGGAQFQFDFGDKDENACSSLYGLCE